MTKQELHDEFWLLTKSVLQDSKIDVSEAMVIKRWLEEHREGNDFDFTIISEKLQFINYKFLGMNLGDMPKLKFWENGLTWAAIGLFLIPIVSALASCLSMKVSTKMNPQPAGAGTEQSQGMMKQIYSDTSGIIMFIIFIWEADCSPALPPACGVDFWVTTI